MAVMLLGPIVFEPMDISGLSVQQRATLNEHHVIVGKPKIQGMGLELNTQDLRVRLHHRLGAVQGRLNAFQKVFESQEALPLVSAQTLIGHYLIESIENVVYKTDLQGVILIAELMLKLKEAQPAKTVIGQAIALGHQPIGSMIEPYRQFLSTGVLGLASQALDFFKLFSHQLKQLRDSIGVIEGVVIDSVLSQMLGDIPMQTLERIDLVLGTHLLDVGQWMKEGLDDFHVKGRDSQEVNALLDYLDSLIENSMHDQAIVQSLVITRGASV